MPYFFAKAAALPGVGEATATTSACSEAILKEAAWISASNCEPMIATFTLPLFGMRIFPRSLHQFSKDPNYQPTLRCAVWVEAASPRAKAWMYAALQPQQPPRN